MAAETQYQANTGIGQAVTANSNLDGTGTLATVLTAASNGTLIKSITIKALGDTSQGMVRLFLYDGSNTRIIEEIPITANAVSATNPAFEYSFDCEYQLEATWVLKASTQTGDDFNIIAEGMDWSYFTSAVRPESTQYTAKTGTTVISTANSNRDGTGTLGTVVTANSSVDFKGLRIDTVTIKAMGTTTMGTVRLFLYDGSNTRLLLERTIPAITQSATETAFEETLNLNFHLEADWSLKASTEKAESFSISAEGCDWRYPAATSGSNFTAASGTATTSEEKLHTLTVPANVLSTGDVLRVYANTEGTNSANAKTFRIYVNTSDSLSGATLLSTEIFTTQTALAFMRLFPVISDTSLRCFSGTTTSAQTQYNANGGTSADTTVPSVADGFYILISGQKANSGETNTVRWSYWKKE